jgi:hypothetical protein
MARAYWKDLIQSSRGGIMSYVGTGIENANQIRGQVHQEFPLQTLGMDLNQKMKWLLEREFEIYEEQSENAGPNFLLNMETYLANNPDSYPPLQAILPITAVTQEVWNILSVLEESLSQGRRTRAGASLEKHIEFLLEREGFVLGNDFAVQQQVEGQQRVKLDFLFPANPNTLTVNPNVCVTCACMTSVNDRARIAVVQVQSNTHRRVPTALGAKQFQSQLDNLGGILQTATTNQFRYVVLPSVVNYYNNHPALMTYQEWFEELAALQPFW